MTNLIPIPFVFYRDAGDTGASKENIEASKLSDTGNSTAEPKTEPETKPPPPSSSSQQISLISWSKSAASSLSDRFLYSREMEASNM